MTYSEDVNLLNTPCPYLGEKSLDQCISQSGPQTIYIKSLQIGSSYIHIYWAAPLILMHSKVYELLLYIFHAFSYVFTSF